MRVRKEKDIWQSSLYPDRYGAELHICASVTRKKINTIHKDASVGRLCCNKISENPRKKSVIVYTVLYIHRKDKTQKGKKTWLKQKKISSGYLTYMPL